MFNNVPFSQSGFNITKLLGGISKTLNIANKAIPIYQQIKPLVNNVPTILKVAKNISLPDIKKSNNNNSNTNSNYIDKSINLNNSNSNNPVFFH